MMKNALFVLLFLVPFRGSGTIQEDNVSRTFSFALDFTYPGDPVFIYDHLTGEISAWWDHSFSEKPYRLFIEARPGGGFYEIFNENGDGARHATVIYAERGKMLRMEGPLGLSGQAIILVCTYSLEPAGRDSTQLTLHVSGAGDFSRETPGIVQQVWKHFLWEQFNPYIRERYGDL
jgi:hypothetical protein